jgi:4-azaleucine resistance transporter AzlC
VTRRDATPTGVPSAHRRDSAVLGVAVGVFGITFGVLASTSGLSIAQACVMSLLVFTGASQFAAVGIIGSGGDPAAAVGSALLLGARNGAYAMSLNRLLPRSKWRRALAAQLVIDESTAMALVQENDDHAREALFITGGMVFIFWNLGTLLGALSGEAIGDPEAWGLDAAFPAGFITFVLPHLNRRPALVSALVGGTVAMLAVPLTPAGAPIVLAVAGALAGYAALQCTPTAETDP